MQIAKELYMANIPEGLKLPGNFFGFLRGTNLAPIANAMGGPNIKPRASIPECKTDIYISEHKARKFLTRKRKLTFMT